MASRSRWRRCGGIEGVPRGILDRHIQQGQKAGRVGARVSPSVQEFVGDLGAERWHIIARLRSGSRL